VIIESRQCPAADRVQPSQGAAASLDLRRNYSASITTPGQIPSTDVDTIRSWCVRTPVSRSGSRRCLCCAAARLSRAATRASVRNRPRSLRRRHPADGARWRGSHLRVLPRNLVEIDGLRCKNNGPASLFVRLHAVGRSCSMPSSTRSCRSPRSTPAFCTIALESGPGRPSSSSRVESFPGPLEFELAKVSIARIATLSPLRSR
jgi:hypothetical protein